MSRECEKDKVLRMSLRGKNVKLIKRRRLKKVALKQIWLVVYLIKCVGSTWRFLIHGAHGPNAHSYKLCMSDAVMM